MEADCDQNAECLVWKLSKRRKIYYLVDMDSSDDGDDGTMLVNSDDTPIALPFFDTDLIDFSGIM